MHSKAYASRTEAVLEDVGLAPLGANAVRVRVSAAAVNPADRWVATGGIRDAFELPATIGVGYDLAGVVTEVGDQVDGFVVGDEVAALHGDLRAPVRAFAETATVEASWAAKIPAGLGVVEAASVPLNALTAAQALDLLGQPDGRSLLVTGAAGGVGGYALALAARAGWQVTGLARQGDGEFLRRAGAVAAVTGLPEREFDAVLDAAALQETALGTVRDGGALVGVLPPAPITPERGIDVTAVNVNPDGERLAELLALSVDGTLEVRVAGQIPLTEAQTAFDKLAAGGQRGRWLLVP